MSYIILTNKEAFTTETKGEHLEPVETYEYHFFNNVKAKYTIVKVKNDQCKIKIIDNDNDQYINHVPLKFFEAFDDVEMARSELQELIGAEAGDAKLVKVS